MLSLRVEWLERTLAPTTPVMSITGFLPVCPCLYYMAMAMDEEERINNEVMAAENGKCAEIYPCT